MLILLKTVIIYLLTNFGNGFLIKKLFRASSGSFVFISLLGILGTVFLQTVLAFLFPLSSFVELFFLLSGFAGLLMFFWCRDFSPILVFKNLDTWFYVGLGAILFGGSFSAYLYDHYSYYVPTITFLREAGFVKGISSFDLLLGQSSFWHIYQASFSHFTDPFLKLNVYLALLFLIYIYESRRWVLLIFLPLFLPFLQQPTPDLPVLVFALIIINEWLIGRDRPMLLYLSLLVVCIKPTAFWLVFVCLGLRIFRKELTFKMLLPIFAVGILWMLKNIYLFGFPVFPVAFLDFDFPWQPNPKILTYSSQIGLMKSYDMHYSYQQIMGFNPWEKVYHWFTIGYKSVFNWAVVICLAVLAWFAIRQKTLLYRMIFVAFLIKFILIVMISAQYRFFLDLYAVTIFLVVRQIPKNVVIASSVALSVIVLLFFSIPGILKGRSISEKWLTGFQVGQLLRPQEDHSVQINTGYKIGNLSFYAPNDPMQKNSYPSLSIYDLEIYNYYGIFPQWSGKGFVQRPLSPQEKKQLEQIIRILKISRP